MKQVLIVEASPMSEASTSRKLARVLEGRLRFLYPEARIARRDVAAEPVPHFDPRGNLAHSDRLVDELLASDVLVIATPMWNFGVPSSLKAWIDHVVRAGKTFHFDENGPVGRAAGTRAIVIVSSGGVFGSGPMQSLDFVVPYLKSVLGFIGIKDVDVIRAEGTAMADHSAAAFERALNAVESLPLGEVVATAPGGRS